MCRNSTRKGNDRYEGYKDDRRGKRESMNLIRVPGSWGISDATIAPATVPSPNGPAWQPRAALVAALALLSEGVPLEPVTVAQAIMSLGRRDWCAALPYS